MPAEWEPHAATWLSWPRREGISFPGLYKRIPALWARMAAELSAGEEVHINVLDEAAEREVQAELARAPGLDAARVFLHRVPTDEPWCRDHGPIFVVRSGEKAELAVTDWRYNAWGGKYPPFDRDDRVPAAIAAILGVPRFEPGMVLEGGSIDVNGRGTLLTTEACLLNPNRNPTLGRAEIEARLRDFLGVTTFVWLGDGIVGDDTDGHVDDIARFVGARSVLAAVEPDPADPNHAPLADNLRRLRAARDQDGRALEVIELPMPGAVEREDTRLPASYANFYIGNAVVLVPIFKHASDAAALEIIGRCFPGRRIVGIDSRELVWGLGAFHCVTQQQPRVQP
jgi:agmatine deiminase